MRDSITSSLRWITFAKLAGQLISWTVTFLVLRLLAPNDYGLMAMATIFVSFAFMFSDLGLGAAIIQTREYTPEHLAGISTLILSIGIALCLVLCVAAKPIAWIFDEPRLTSIVSALSLQFLFSAISVVPKALLQRELRFKAYSSIEVSSALATGFVTLILALRGYGVWALVGGTLTGSAWTAVAANILRPANVRYTLSLASSRNLLRTGGNITASRIMWFMLTQADTFIVGKFLGKDALGIYSVATQLSTMPMSKIMAIINQVALTGFARIQDDQAAVRKTIATGVSLLAFIAFPLFWGMSAMSTELIVTFLGEKWRAAALPLQLIPLIVPLRMIANYLSTAVQGIGRSEIDTKNTFLGMVVMPPSLYLGSFFGLIGVCLAWLLVMPALFVINTRRLLVAARTPVLDIYKSLLPPLCFSVVSYGAVALARVVIPVNTLSNIASLAMLSAVEIFIYIGCYWLFRKSELLEMVDTIRNKPRPHE